MRSAATALTISLLCVSIASAPLRSQTAEQKPSFEIASVKLFIPPPDGQPFLPGFHLLPGGRFTATNVTFKQLLTYAYRIQEYQVVGGPAWISSDRWEIIAKAEEGTLHPQMERPTPNVLNQVKLMVQTVLGNRFQLKLHKETRQLPLYDLVVNKGGYKLHLSEDQTPPELPMPGKQPPPPPPAKPGEPTPPPRGNLGVVSGLWDGRFSFLLLGNAVGFPSIVQVLSLQLKTGIIDNTGLKAGLYDVKLQWIPDPTENGSMQASVIGRGLPPRLPNQETLSIFTAIQDQLGLKLVPTKGPVEVLVIDSVQKPTVN